MPETVVLKDQERMYLLLRLPDGDWCLEVTTGGFAMDVCRMNLTPEEAQRYREEGKDYLDDLAYRVARREKEYKNRLRWD